MKCSTHVKYDIIIDEITITYNIILKIEQRSI